MVGEALVGLSGAGVVWALVQAVKSGLDLPDRTLPLLALALGIAWNLGLRAAEVTDMTYGAAAITGITSGLAASGLWAQGKKYLAGTGLGGK